MRAVLPLGSPEIEHPITRPEVQAALQERACEGTRIAIGPNGSGRVVVSIEFDYKDGVPVTFRAFFATEGTRINLTGRRK